MLDFLKKKLLKYYILWLILFRRGTIKKNLSTRKEKPKPFIQSCEECPGYCCWTCPNHDKKNRKCKVWGQADYLCRTYPVSPLQLEKMGLKDKCRFYWDEK